MKVNLSEKLMIKKATLPMEEDDSFFEEIIQNTPK